MKSLLTYASAVLSAALTACASTGVIPMDRDSYFIGKKDGSPGIGISLSNKAEVYREAVHAVAERQLYRWLVGFFPESRRTDPVAGGILLRGALIGGIKVHFTVSIKVVQRPFREKGGE